MTQLSRRSVLMVLAGALLFSSCSSAGFKRVYTARDSEGRIKTSHFASDKTEIHVIGELVSGRDDVIVSIKLKTPDPKITFQKTEIAPGKGDLKIDFKLVSIVEQATDDTSSGDTSQQVSEEGPWAKGDYEATLYIDGSKEESVKFKVGD